MTALYNEIEPYAAQWLRNLVDAGHIAAGTVDERSIVELKPDDVRDAGQCHFFAGIGGWSAALRLADWPDDIPVWTGSCPCQPFSTAGRKKGFADERHLWPVWFNLIRECRPAIIFGEQVASPDGLTWLDVVRTDLEGAGYAFAAFDLCAAGVGAPHIRQRLYFVAVACDERRERIRLHLRKRRSQPPVSEARRDGEAGIVADAERNRSGTGRLGVAHGWPSEQPDRHGNAGIMGNTGVEGAGRDTGAIPRTQGEGASERLVAGDLVNGAVVAGPTNGFWRDAEWIPCRDGKTRPVEPGTFPLAHGVSARVGRLRAYGNAIVPPLAATFIEAVMEALCA
jgi:DNA (cytosine-5)-methyltransferase 1